MDKQSFSLSFLVDESPQRVFDAINNVPAWWTANFEGNSRKLNDEFEVRFGDVHYSKQKLIDVVENEKVIWLVTDSKLSFVNNKREWVNTRIIFEISRKGGKTQVVFRHDGLAEGVECFDACSDAWSGYILGSLRNWIITRKDQVSITSL
jgi:hypothetical protein